MELRKEDEVALALRSCFESYGYKKYRMGRFEEYSLYLENKSFLESDNIITFNDLDGRLLALKPDVTLSIAKNARRFKGQLEKLYYQENVYRPSRSTREYKELGQMGLEAMGAIDGYVTLEVVTLALKSLAAVDSEFVLNVSHIGFVAGLIDSLNLEYEERAAVFECVTGKNLHDLSAICQKAGVSAENAKALAGLISINGTFEVALEQAKALIVNSEMAQAIADLEELKGGLDEELAERVRLDFSIVNDTNYYNGIIFLGYTAAVPRPVLSGGRYDKLLEKLNGTKGVGAIGFALYLDEISGSYSKPASYDADVVILYDSSVKPGELRRVVSALVAEKQIVRAEKVVPTELKFKKLMRLTANGLEEVENA